MGFAISNLAADTTGDVTLDESTGFDITTVEGVVGVTNVPTFTITSGGAVTDTLSAPACPPTKAFRFALGCTFSAIVTPSGCEVMAIDTLLQPLEQSTTDPDEGGALFNADFVIAAHPHRQLVQPVIRGHPGHRHRLWPDELAPGQPGKRLTVLVWTASKTGGADASPQQTEQELAK